MKLKFTAVKSYKSWYLPQKLNYNILWQVGYRIQKYIQINNQKDSISFVASKLSLIIGNYEPLKNCLANSLTIQWYWSSLDLSGFPLELRHFIYWVCDIQILDLTIDINSPQFLYFWILRCWSSWLQGCQYCSRLIVVPSTSSQNSWVPVGSNPIINGKNLQFWYKTT